MACSHGSGSVRPAVFRRLEIFSRGIGEADFIDGLEGEPDTQSVAVRKQSRAHTHAPHHRKIVADLERRHGGAYLLGLVEWGIGT